MKTASNNMLFIAVLTAGVIATPLAIAGTLSQIKTELATAIQQKQTISTNSHGFIAAKYILELTMGGNKNKAAKTDRTHASWCAKVHKSYDAASNTFTAPNGKQYPCLSLFQ